MPSCVFHATDTQCFFDDRSRKNAQFPEKLAAYGNFIVAVKDTVTDSFEIAKTSIPCDLSRQDGKPQ